MVSEAKKAAKTRYDAKTAKYFRIKLNVNTDAGIIELLEKQENVQGFIKSLLRKELENRGE